MGSRARIAVAINRTEVLVTGSHWGGYIDENGPVLLAEYSTFESAKELANLPYISGGIESMDKMLKSQEKKEERWHHQARSHVENQMGRMCIDANQLELSVVDSTEALVAGMIADWKKDDAPKQMRIEALMTERNVPSDIEAVYLWKEGAWYVAKPFQKRVSDVPFKSLVSELNASDIYKFCTECIADEYWSVRHGENELTCDGCYERERG